MNIPLLDATSSRSALLEGMNRPWESLLHLAQKSRYPKRHSLLLTGEALLDFYYLNSGRLRIMHCSEDGSERGMLYISEGTLFNEATALARFDDPDCRLYCLDTCEVYRFSGSLLHSPDFVAAHPELIVNLMKSVSTKVLVMHATLADTSGNNALKQVSRFLYSLVHLHGGTQILNPKMTQDEVAVLLGIHRTTLVRVLQELRRCGALVRFTKTQLHIGDLSILKEFAEL